jgi:hypothetical protein
MLGDGALVREARNPWSSKYGGVIMQRTFDLDRLLNRIAESFAKGIPNGWLLNWDSNRFQRDFVDAVRPCSLKNRTSFDFARCNQYDVEIEPQENGYAYVLTLRLSFVLPYFCLHWTEYNVTRTEGCVVAVTDVPEGFALESKIRGCALRLGFEELPDELLNAKTFGVQLELSDDDDVTVSKCLFDDYSG